MNNSVQHQDVLPVGDGMTIPKISLGAKYPVVFTAEHHAAHPLAQYTHAVEPYPGEITY